MASAQSAPAFDGRRSKLMTMAEAIEQLVPDGSSIVVGTFIEQKAPFSAAHQLMRAGRRDLELIGPVSDIIFDQLVGAGAVSRCRISWNGLFAPSSAHCFRRALDPGTSPAPGAGLLEVVEYSFLTLSLALTAGALGVPYLPARTAVGTSLPDTHPGLRLYSPPFGEGQLVAVEALRPDVAILPVQRADEFGNSHTWGAHGLSVEAAHAAREVILVAEELVDEDLVRADPNRNIFPGLAVNAVVHEPWCCHPSPVQGLYRRDAETYDEYEQASASRDGFARWLDDWVLGVADRAAYMERVGEARRRELRVHEHAYAPAVDYGF